VSRDPTPRLTQPVYFFLPLCFAAWARSLAAADFSAFVALGLARTLPALDAAFFPVAMEHHLLFFDRLQRYQGSS